MTAEEIAKKIRTDEMNGCNNDEFCELHAELIRSYALQIAEKAVEEAKLNRLGYPDEMANRIARLAVDDMERDIISRIKTEIGGK